MGLSLGHRQPGARKKDFGANPNVRSIAGIGKANGVVKRRTPLARAATTNRTGLALRRNGARNTNPAKGTEQTVGIRAKLRHPGRTARVASSTGNKVSMNHLAIHPSTGPTVGLKGALVNGLKGTASSLISRGSTPKGSRNTHRPNGQSAVTVGLRGARANGLISKPSTLQKSPTLGNTAGVKRVPAKGTKKLAVGTGQLYSGGRGIPFKGNRRVVQSSVPVSGTIPAVVRRAASRHAGAANPGAGKKAQQPYTAKMILQNSGYKQQVAGGGRFAGVK